MNEQDLTRIKNFIRVCFEVEETLKISWAQKKVLLKVVELWGLEPKAPMVTEVAMSVHGASESSVYRHLKPLIKKGLLRLTEERQDHRVKRVEPTHRLLKILAAKT